MVWCTITIEKQMRSTDSDQFEIAADLDRKLQMRAIRRLIVIGSLVLTAGATCVIWSGLALFRTFDPQVITSQSRYQDTLAEWSHLRTSHFPLQVPSSPAVVKFRAAPGPLQAADVMALYVQDTAASVQAEIARLTPTALAMPREDWMFKHVQWTLEQFGLSTKSESPSAVVLICSYNDIEDYGLFWCDPVAGEMLYLAESQ